jgi:mersacidin/lichenicidin family type 2 lantibiotic
MTKTIRAWKDPSFRATLSPEELAELPANPAGESWSSMSERELGVLVGGDVEAQVSNPNSCGYFCTFTTECPVLTICSIAV